jgi:hypothetical protein
MLIVLDIREKVAYVLRLAAGGEIEFRLPEPLLNL